MNTVYLLMGRYDSLPIIPVEDVCRDFFPHLELSKFLRKISSGEIELPLTRIEQSQKAAKGVSLIDLAKYLDKRIAAARREQEQMAT